MNGGGIATIIKARKKWDLEKEIGSYKKQETRNRGQSVDLSILSISHILPVFTADLYKTISGGHTLGNLTVARSFEAHRDLLTSVENTFDTNIISRYDYVNDAAGRRTGVKYSAGGIGGSQ